jgi:hypothetical protein
MILQLSIIINLIPYRALIVTCYSMSLVLANKISHNAVVRKFKKSKM